MKTALLVSLLIITPMASAENLKTAPMGFGGGAASAHRIVTKEDSTQAQMKDAKAKPDLKALSNDKSKESTNTQKLSSAGGSASAHIIRQPNADGNLAK